MVFTDSGSCKLHLWLSADRALSTFLIVSYASPLFFMSHRTLKIGVSWWHIVLNFCILGDVVMVYLSLKNDGI